MGVSDETYRDRRASERAMLKAEYEADASILAIAFAHSHSYGYVHDALIATGTQPCSRGEPIIPNHFDAARTGRQRRTQLDGRSHKAAHWPTQILKIPRQTMHAVHHQGVALTDIGQRRLKLRTVRILATDLINEDPIQRHAIRLRLWNLCEGHKPSAPCDSDAATVSWRSAAAHIEPPAARGCHRGSRDWN